MVIREMLRCAVLIVLHTNLPGWRWARIKQLVLVGLSSSWHSEDCNALGGPFRVAHSIISVCGNMRSRGCQHLASAFGAIPEPYCVFVQLRRGVFVRARGLT